MTQNPFQPWKPSFAPSSSFYRKASGGENDLISAYNKPSKSAGDGVLSYAYDMNAQDNLQQMYQSTTAPPMTTSSSSNSVSDSDPPSQHHQHQQSSSASATPAKAQQSSKFSIFSQLLNLNKIQSFDNLLINATLDDDDLSADKRHGIRKLMEQAISDESKQQIAFILDKISALRPAEKLLLYLKMPGGHSDVDPLKVSQNPLGSRSEITHTINWVRSHLEHDEKVSIPKQEVYEDYVSFCAKINIKPLSTADFGKVMKQVFPDIKPRRLGTRGHSRYCYAAMRKATKLPPPFLPDLSTPSSSESSSQAASGEIDESSTWQTIKTWSETLLSEQFDSLDDLANHIKHNVNGSSSSSKTALQRKLLQREFKDKKKNCNIQLMAKKRRKKRRISSDSTQENQFNENIQIKQEKETDVSAGENNLSEDSSELPMNLTSSDRFHNDIVDFSKAIPKDETIECLKNKLDQKFTSEIASEEIFSQDSTSQEQQYMLCKKVRQAQQMKLTASQSSTIGGSQFTESSSIVPHPVVANLVDSTVNDMLMPSKIPPKRKLKKDSDSQIKKSKSNSSQESPYSSSLNQVEQATDFEMEKEDFILPRERFISICNMDKNALDTYLNPSGENSPDLEMMQYFDEDDQSKNESDEEDLGQAPTSVPLLENYQLVSEGRASDNKAIDKISQLRSMLEEHNQKSMSIADSSLIKNLLQKSSTSADVINSANSQMTSYGTSGSCFLAATRTSTNSTMPLRTFDESEKLVPHSPNTRRKNFSFVPISDHSTRVRNINLHPAFKDDFVSPRATSVNRRTSNSSMNMRNNMSAVDPKPIPLLGVNNTAFSACRPVNFKIEPDSEPSSPSMNQNFNYSPQSTQHQSHFQFQTLNGDQTSYEYPVETRSQSVPPHCTNNSNMFNNNRTNNNGYNGYSSACSSMAPTPVPPEYQEFSDPNILDIFDNEQQTSSGASVKLESNDDVIDLLDSEILNSDSNHQQQQQQTARQSFTISRSVPNTPLPFHTSYVNGNSMNAFSCMSGKSVPTTPVGQNGHFRYSPELQRTRDFLINGYNNNNISAVNHNDKLIKDNNGSLSSDIEELSNLDANCFGTL